MSKIFVTIFITIFLNHCGFSPIYVGNPKEIIVAKSEIIGDKNLAFDLVDNHKAVELNWAILDFAALVCKPKPLCEVCIIKNNCRYYQLFRK